MSLVDTGVMAAVGPAGGLTCAGVLGEPEHHHRRVQLILHLPDT